MDFSLSEEQVLLREGANRFLADRYGFEQRNAVLRDHAGCSAVNWAAFADLGWLALPLPESAGGLGGSAIDVALVAEAMGRRLVLEPYATTVVLGARILERANPSSAGGALLERIGAGQLRIALADSEPANGGAMPAVTRARSINGGFALTGSKVLAYDAPSAQQLLVTARLGPGDEPAIFLVPRDAAGLAIEAYPLIDGTHAADIALRDVSLPHAALLLQGAAVHDALGEAEDHLTLARVAEAVGMMEAVLQLTAEHLRNRVQFGQPLAKFQALQHRMAEMFVEAHSTRSILYRGLAHAGLDAALRRPAVAAAKVVAARALQFVCANGVQLHGGMGMTEECAVGHYFRRALAFEKAFGDLATHLDRMTITYRA
jgi:alkylation response protein AidB-like acyl-CoA dehydrogenase